MPLFSTLRSYAADPCLLPRWQFHRAHLAYKLISRRHPGSPLGYTNGVSTELSDIARIPPQLADDGRFWSGYQFYFDNCNYYSYWWIWDSIDLKIAHYGIIKNWRKRMLGKFGWFWKRMYRLAARLRRYNDGSFSTIRVIADLLEHGYLNGSY